jgi:hypothetical protein
LATTACPQLREDDFRTIDAASGGSGGGADAAAPSSCGASAVSGVCGGTGGTPPAPPPPDEPDAGADAAPDASLDCGAGAVRGPRGCYAVEQTLVTWSEARTRCRQRGAGWDLAIVLDAEENQLAVALAAGSEAWLGGTDVDAEGEWVWVRDGTAFPSVQSTDAGEYAPWASGEPNDQNDSDCLRVLTTGVWADWECDGTYAFVCQAPAP